ncbi:16287_t:CDS:2 [Dentiscutata heterogama]|uniref:16287_t:CDS:1 n=1 Tax=Dentiscutata heterogama TaxID=1316150 RepID=A0ACA9KGG2_9GLOM|nr:16287_t:CDS:2 [Dentiscutata heterogama]
MKQIAFLSYKIEPKDIYEPTFDREKGDRDIKVQYRTSIR